MAQLIANRIIEGKYTFERCPDILKEQVKQILTDLNLSELAK